MKKSRENGKINQKKEGAPRRALNKVLYGGPFPARSPALNPFICHFLNKRYFFRLPVIEIVIPSNT